MAREYVDREAVEAQAAREWTYDPKLREEFRGRREAWMAYALAAASDRAKVHCGRVVRGADVRDEITRGASGGASGEAPRVICAPLTRSEVGGAAQVAVTGATAASGAGIVATQERSGQQLFLLDAAHYQPGGALHINAMRRAYGY